ncbi:MAG: hypothetical protein IJ746_07900 [Ruminococcus sp.]|nr:hypothetical protein [Ruminococcus sp.]
MNNRFCQTCGNPLAENERFCGKCGTPADGFDAPAQAAPVQAPIPEPVPEQAPIPEAAPVPEQAPVQDMMQATMYAGATEAAQTVQDPAAQAQDFYNSAAASAQQTADQAAAFAESNASPYDPAAVPGAVPGPVPEAAPAKAGGGAAAVISKYKLPIIIAAVVIVLAVAGIIVFKQLTKYQKIDSKDLFAVKFSGLDGQGTAVAYLNCYDADPNIDKYDDDFDKDAQDYSDYFSDDNKDLLKAFDKAGDKSDAKKMRKALLKQKSGKYVLKLKLSETKDLKNGDKITCTVDYDEDELKEANIKLENTEFEVEVEGLIVAEELDMFNGFNYSFSGIDESGTMTYDSTNADLPFISYVCYYTSGLKNGDSVSVSAEIDFSQVENKQSQYSADKYDSDEDREEAIDDGTYEGPEYIGTTFDYNGKTYIVKDSYASKDFTVSGLNEPDEIDIFSGIKVTFTGADPYLYADSVDKEGCDSVIKDNVYFYIESDYNQAFKVGDTVRIKASVYEDDLKKAGFKPANLPDTDGNYYYDYTIEDNGSIGHYILDDASAEDHEKLDAVEGSFDEMLNSFLEDNLDRWYIGDLEFGDGVKSFSEPEAYKGYLVKCTGFDDGTIDKYNDKTYIVKVYKITATYEEDEKSKEKTFYFAARINNGLIDGEGNAQAGYSTSTAVNTKLGDVVDSVLSWTDEGERVELKTF